MTALGDSTFGAVVLMYIADFVPRVRAGLEALGVGRSSCGWATGRCVGPRQRSGRRGVQRVSAGGGAAARARPGDVGGGAAARRGQHHCRLCKSLREGTALEAGGSETLYDDIEHYETSSAVSTIAKKQRCGMRMR